MNQELSVDEILADYFSPQLTFASKHKGKTIADVERTLRNFLETKSDHLLPPMSRALLDIERRESPDNAYCRLACAHVLLEVLPAYLDAQELVPAGPEAQRVRRLQIEGLVRTIIDREFVDPWDVICGLHNIRHSLDAR
jgi:hypothetical protein